MHSLWLDRRFFVSSVQVPPAEFEKIVGIFVSSFLVVVSTVQLRQVLIFVVLVIIVV